MNTKWKIEVLVPENKQFKAMIEKHVRTLVREEVEAALVSNMPFTPTMNLKMRAFIREAVETVIAEQLSHVNSPALKAFIDSALPAPLKAAIVNSINEESQK